MKKKYKVKWGNVLLILCAIACIWILISDAWMLLVHHAQLTWWGVITDIICILILVAIEDLLKE